MRNMKFNSITVWLLIAAMVGASSFAIAVQGSNPDEQDKFVINKDVKPKTNSFIFTGLPVTFDAEDDLTLTCADQANPADKCLSEGTKMINSQEILLNFNTDVGEEVRITIPLVNHSEDEQIVMLKAIAPEQLILDIDEGAGTEGVRLVGMNTWIMNVFLTDVDCPTGFGCILDFDLIVNAEHDGSFTVMLQLLTVG